MFLLDEIIDLLSNENESLNQALLKTKVLLHKLGNKESTVWVNDEINGYGEGKQVPLYRVVTAQIYGNVANSGWRRTKVLLPIDHLTESIKKSLVTETMGHALAVLEEFVSNENNSLIHPISPGLNQKLSEPFGNGYMVESAWIQIERSQVLQVLIEIRSRLLDFVLELQNKLGDNVTNENLKQKAVNIDTPAMFANSIFGGNTTFGDNTTFVLGHGNSQQVTNTNIKGDFNALAEKLKKAGVEESDIASLENAISTDADSPELVQQKFGPAVRDWMHGMMGKAINLAWQIEVGLAGGLLTNALQAYYFA